MKGYTEILNKETDITYSPDDKGYYLTQYKTFGEKRMERSSPVYADKTQLLEDLNCQKIKWGEWW